MENQFPCQDTAGNPQCISELQFCDGVSDCADGTDEPTDCLNGIVRICVFINFFYITGLQCWLNYTCCVSLTLPPLSY